MRVKGAVGAFVLAAVGAVALAGPAQATEGFYPVSDWQLRQIGLGETEFSDATDSRIVDETTVELTKPDGTTGTSVETANLGVSVENDTTLTVSYTLGAGVETTTGAIRMFWYDHPDGDTLAEAPTGVAVADGSGTLTLAIPGGSTVGTMGLVYDASNATSGTVTFTDLRVGDTPVLFLRPEPPVEPSDEPTDEPSDKPSEKPSEPSNGQAGGDGKELPKTGSPLVPVAVAGVVLLVAGVLFVVGGRRQRWLFR